MVISTPRVNCYGYRVVTEGIETGQYEKNPVLLYMHRRGSDVLPIGRVENLRREGDALIGTPVFDVNDPFAKQVADKWENGFLRMCSPSLELLEKSTDKELLLAGQTRPTVTRCRLQEVSIVDIGGNDDALQLCAGGEVLQLSSGMDCEQLPLLQLDNTAEQSANKNPNKTKMKKETLDLLGLGEGATEQEIHEKVKLMKERGDRAEQLQLSAIEHAVDAAIGEKRVTADKRDHFIQLGKSAGLDALNETLKLMQPSRKPSDVIAPTDGKADGEHGTEHAKLSDLTPDAAEQLKKDNPKEYARLFKAETGVELAEI